jgi:RES domain-containing protein
MRVWRIYQAHYADQLEGLGGIYVEGRWHFKGFRIVYTSSTVALASLEVLANASIEEIPDDLRLLEIDLPDPVSVEVCDPTKLCANWHDFNPYPHETQEFGTRWLEECRTAVLMVPSAVVPDIARESNYLINPAHPEAAEIHILSDNPFSFDPRVVDENNHP